MYQAELKEQGCGFVVRFAFGRRGSTLQTGTKTAAAVPFETAKALYDRLVKEKTAKGYTRGTEGTPYVGTPAEARDSGVRPQLLNPIDDEELERVLADDAFWAQEKLDGKRLLLRKNDDGEVVGINRKGLLVAIPRPIHRAAAKLPGAFLLDGEAVGNTYYIFDCLERHNRNLRSLAFSRRWSNLDFVLRNGPVCLAPTVAGGEKRGLFELLQETGREGIVFKRHDAPYTPGRPANGGPQLKYKFTSTVSVIVAGINKDKRSVKMVLGDGRKSVDVGNVTIPPNAAIPKAGSVIEVRYLYAFRGGALYQPVYIHERDDVLPAECGFGQLKYKAEEDGDE